MSKQASHVVLHSIYSGRYWEYLDMDIDIALYMYLPPLERKMRRGEREREVRYVPRYVCLEVVSHE